MTRVLAALLVLLSCAACASPRARGAAGTPPAAPFRVAVMGDMPYADPWNPRRDSILAAYRAVLDAVAAERAAFVVHVGDITGALCSDSLYAVRAREFAAMPHPLVYTFGDNEWTDCARDTTGVPGGRDPLERLARLRAVFTAGDRSLGARPLPLERQSAAGGAHAAYRENVRWRAGGVLFVALHVVGANNNRGRGAAPSAEFVARNAANLAWLQEAFAVAGREGARGVAVFMQANPFEPPAEGPDGRPPSGFEDVVRELPRLAAAFGRPVALVHGDTHTFRVDQPFPRPDAPRPLTNLTRAETYGNPNHHALVMTVDPGHPNVFRFEPLLVEGGGGR